MKKSDPETTKYHLFFFLMGCLLTLSVVAIILNTLFNIEVREEIAWPNTEQDPKQYPQKLLSIPNEKVLREIRKLKGSFDNTLNPIEGNTKYTKLFTASIPREDSFQTLRPGIKIFGHVLRSLDDFNFEPPVLYLTGQPVAGSALADYLQEYKLRSFEINANENGLRVTLPIIKNEKKTLIIGDSVAFGLGVDDHESLASHLQSKNKSIEVINAAMNGNGSDDNINTLKYYSKKKIDHLIFVVCQNDFKNNLNGFNEYLSDLTKLIQRIDTHSINFKEITIVFTPYLHQLLPTIYNSNNALKVEEGLTSLEKRLKRLIPARIKFINWYAVAKSYEKKMKTPYAIFSLYVDYIHLSSQGNKVLADAIIELAGNEEPR